jgi:hypothetical protein
MIAVISHDAGGAEILSSYIRRNEIDCLYVLDGPALVIFERKLGSLKLLSLNDALDQSTSIICGTSWQSDIELQAIKLARSSGKHSIAYLDHWVNYHDRFLRSVEVVLPDEIWVGDMMAKTIAQKVFPDILIRLVDNPYFKDIQDQLAKQVIRSSVGDSITVLYVCEPISTHALLRHNDAKFWGYTEEDALRYFLSNITALRKPIDRVLIRPHPSEQIEKYSWIKNEFQLPIELAGNRSLFEEILDCDVIVGCESMAMIVALLAGKKVISCIPPGGRPCVLPHTEIINFQSILEN